MEKDLFLGLIMHSGNGDPVERIQFLVEFFRSIRDQEILTEKELEEIYGKIIDVVKVHKSKIDEIEHS